MPIEILEHRIAPASFLVTSLADSDTKGTLRYAINGVDASMDASNTIIFLNTLKGQIVLKSALPAITNNVVIGGITSAKITINGDNHFQIFNVQGYALAVNFSDITLSHGNSLREANGKTTGGGALYVNDYTGTVKVASCTITDSVAPGIVGAITSQSQTSGLGGGIFLKAGTLDVTTSKITGNTAAGGHNTSTTGATGGRGAGGGIYVGSSGTLNLTSSTVSGNIARGGAGTGGARAANGNSTTGPGNGQRGGAGGSAQGGGLWSYGTATILKSTISGNVVVGGRGANGGGGGNGFTGQAGGNGGSGGYGGQGLGGGIYCEGSYTIILNSSTVSGNVADGNVGGLGAPAGLSARGQKPSHHGFNGGIGEGYGGGIHSSYTTLQTIDATIARNVADKGGGLFLYENSSTQLDNSTIAFNAARRTGYGGGLWTYVATNDPVVVISTVIGENVAGNRAKPGQDLYVYVLNGPATISAYNSLIESYNQYNNNGTLESTVSNPNSTDILGKNPLLEALHNNGGLTETCLPNPLRSPLLGAGTTPALLGLPNSPNIPDDQRGHSREIGGTVDIGAVEIA